MAKTALELVKKYMENPPDSTDSYHRDIARAVWPLVLNNEGHLIYRGHWESGTTLWYNPVDNTTRMIRRDGSYSL